MFRDPGLDRATEAIPSRQHQPALRPTEHPWNGAKVLDRARFLARRRPTSDVESRDFGDDGRGPEILDEAFGLVNEAAIGLEGQRRQLLHRFEIFMTERALSGLQQAGLKRRCGQDFQIVATDLGVGIFAGDDLALFGDANLAVHRAAWLRNDGVITRSAPAADRTAASVK